jgi:hypothetical protein
MMTIDHFRDAAHAAERFDQIPSNLRVSVSIAPSAYRGFSHGLTDWSVFAGPFAAIDHGDFEWDLTGFDAKAGFFHGGSHPIAPFLSGMTFDLRDRQGEILQAFELRRVFDGTRPHLRQVIGERFYGRRGENDIAIYGANGVFVVACRRL